MKPFLSEDFLLHTPAARTLYHDFAKEMPILDYHCHLPAREIAENTNFKSLTWIWLNGDHYKWRPMRPNGVPGRYITGDSDDYEKFQAWAETVPRTLRNPLYHWTHLELKRYFGITGKLLNSETAEEIYRSCSEMLQSDDMAPRSILRRMNVKAVFTTDDPVDTLEHHFLIRKDPSFTVRVLPAFRPDRALGVDSPKGFNDWVDRLEAAADFPIGDFESLVEALRKRHDFFHEAGCRISDHGIEHPYVGGDQARLTE